MEERTAIQQIYVDFITEARRFLSDPSQGRTFNFDMADYTETQQTALRELIAEERRQMKEE